MNKYYGFSVKENREKGGKEFPDTIKEPIEHLFDEHKYCGDCCEIKDELKYPTHQSLAKRGNKKKKKK